MIPDKLTEKDFYVIKKDGTREKFKPSKIIKAVEKSAYRALTPLTDEEKMHILQYVENYLSDYKNEELTVSQMHNLVEAALQHNASPEVAKSYRDYRNYKTDFVEMINSVYKKAQSIMYIGDKENSNTDSALVSTKRSLIFNQLNKELYQKFFMTTSELQACRDGYIYVHDMSARRDTFNCCLSDVKSILENGFEMGNLNYSEPKTLESAFDVMGDVITSAASQQYGGFTIPRVDEILSKYAKLSYDKYYDEELKNYASISGLDKDSITDSEKEKIEEIAMDKVQRDMEQGFQGWEYKFNSVSSSRGDYPFTTVTIGLGTDKFSKMATSTYLKVRAEGQGEDGKKRAVLFPKIVFTYTDDLHGEGKINEDLFRDGIRCSLKAMYPDWLSLDGDTTISEMYHKYGEVIAPMGCVDASSVITYRFNEKIETATYKKLWELVESNMIPNSGIKQQLPDSDLFLYANVDGLEIYDTNKGFVKVKRVIKNFNKKWKKIIAVDGDKTYSLLCTYDHPLPVINHNADNKQERVAAEYLDASYSIFVNPEYKGYYDSDFKFNKVKSKIIKIKDVKNVLKFDYAYDVTTESDHFEVNGIDSHNCRAFLSPYYERGGFEPADENDKPVFTGRWNGGVVSLHLPMILAKSRKENKDFYEVLDYYLELIRNLHKRTRDYLGELKASTNPLQFCEGGCYRGHLDYHDKIKPLMDYVTFSFGITALNELNRLYNGKSITEDGEFPLEVMKYINNKLKEFKEEDHILYAIYGTPAESLCGTQVQQFRRLYGIVDNVSDREYVSNSFHCHVSEDITPIEKQDSEYRFWNLFEGGRIQYVKYPINYNEEAVITLVRRAMKMGFYEGVNLSLSYCDNCGYEELNMDKCPKCGSDDIVKIERMNGYLSYSRVHGDTRLNAAKMAEIKERKSM